MLNQKQAVINAVLSVLPNFAIGSDIALNMLAKHELERIKEEIAHGIISGVISYGKDNTNVKEVVSYSKSLVMNHLKKAKELNGSNSVIGSINKSQKNNNVNKSGIDSSVLPKDLAEYVAQLV